MDEEPYVCVGYLYRALILKMKGKSEISLKVCFHAKGVFDREALHLRNLIDTKVITPISNLPSILDPYI